MMMDQQSILIPDLSEPGFKMSALAAKSDQGCSNRLATDCRLHQNLVTKCVTVGTWNVRTLYASGKVEKLEIEMDKCSYDYNILGLAEMRWIRVDESTLDNGDKIWWSGEPETRKRSGISSEEKHHQISSLV